MRFEGFPEGGIAFLLELQAEQDRAWFKCHQRDYERLLRDPLAALMAELRERLLDRYPSLAAAEARLFRIQRDTRFSHDKTPYKTYVAASLPLAEGDGTGRAPSIYVSYGLDQEYLGLGLWHMEGERLQRYRAAVDDAARGERLAAVLARLERDGFERASMGRLTRVPAPYARDHPRADLLTRKGLAVGQALPAELAGSRALLDWAAERLRDGVDFVAWLRGLDEH